jgi:hypothetical protein
MAKCTRRLPQHVGPLILKQFSFLKTLCKTKSDKKRCEMLHLASCEQLLSLVEVCHNIISSNFHLTSRQKKKLLPFANTVRELARARSEKRARAVIRHNQIGGGGPAILAAILSPILIEAAQHLIAKVASRR